VLVYQKDGTSIYEVDGAKEKVRDFSAIRVVGGDTDESRSSSYTARI
jgi:hypothetical protein